MLFFIIYYPKLQQRKRIGMVLWHTVAQFIDKTYKKNGKIY